ncbi:unnamed protein product [Toxocara canis]|uniref:Late endosomal/lysosomal adaptor and MAPK and MTOR activator 5 n=1 Tax=Toxocara canis TaxID=6265 RepID=A0A183UPS5_TOXCA|nr:unnamed protein product [Toxocara canis]
MGVLEDKAGEPNCMLVTCNGVCQLNEKSVLTEGVVSVVISRDEQVSGFLEWQSISDLANHVSSCKCAVQNVYVYQEFAAD